MYPKRKKRSESFLGIHFDFHARPQDQNIGSDTTPELIQEIIDRVRPDYIQCDCKGHPGWSSYPTQVGHAAPGIQSDALRIWREVTAKNGVALYMHYSGVWDNAAIADHPEWAAVNADGTPHENSTSVFSPYADELLIPQLKELCDEYGVDGVWIDGDSWAVIPDYCETVRNLYRQKTGRSELPKSPEEEGYDVFMEINREGYRAYVLKITQAMKAHNPDFQVCCNWAYTSFMPEPVPADIAFISGDYSWVSSLNSARFEGRIMARQGKPWDLMAWGFTSTFEDMAWTHKSPVQLCREAAMVLALGGGFQAYFTQTRTGRPKPAQLQAMIAAAEFCRARQPFCHRGEPVPQIGILYPTEGFYARIKDRCFGSNNDRVDFIRGMLLGLLDNQYSVELLANHQLTGRMQEYPLIVVPEWDTLSPALLSELKAYVYNGGKLLVTGQAVKHFEEELQVCLGEANEKTAWVEADGWLAGIKCPIQEVELKGASPLAGYYEYNDICSPYGVSAATAAYGKGRVTGIFFDIGTRYLKGRSVPLREYLGARIKELFPDPMVKVSGSHLAEVVLTRNRGKLMVHLINMTNNNELADIYTIDEIPLIGPLEIQIRLEHTPSRILLQPSGKSLDFSFEEGIAQITLPRLEIYDILEIHFAE